MSLPYPDWKEVAIGNDSGENKTLRQDLNDALSKLIRNDDRFNFDDDLIPDIWRCRWYNKMPSDQVSSQLGFPRGYAVWVNTEDLDQFIDYRYDEISAIVSKNSKLAIKLKDMEGDIPGTKEFFRTLVFNEGSTTKESGGPYSEPLFYIGDIRGKTQIMVSLSDGNICPPYQTSEYGDWTISDWWVPMFDYDIFRTNEERLSGCMSSIVSSVLDLHLGEYHLGIDKMDESEKEALETRMDGFVKRDLSGNLSSIRLQKFISHRTESPMDGFDFVEDFQIRRSQAFPKANRWYRHWKSGFLEQGGMIVLGDSGSGFGDGMGVQYAFDQETGKINPEFIQVTLPIRYDYPITFTKRFYHMDPDGTIQRNGVLDSENRYSAKVTTVLLNGSVPYQSVVKSNIYQSCEVANIRNGSFWIRLDQNAAGYSFYVSGFLRVESPRQNLQLPDIF